MPEETVEGVLLGAISQHEVGLGLLLVTAFSLGLAATLTALGLIVVYASRMSKRLRGRVSGRLAAVSKDGEKCTTFKDCKALLDAGKDIDFPFQKHIHQLPHDEFLECLVDVFEASRLPPDAAPPR